MEYYIVSSVGGVVAIFIFSLVFKGLFRKLNKVKQKIYSVNLAYFLGAIIAGYGLAEGTNILKRQPVFFESIFIYGLSTIFVLLVVLGREDPGESSDSKKIGEEKVLFIKKLFRGEVSLPVTYWIFTILIGNIFLAGVYKFLELYYVDFVKVFGGWFILIVYLFGAIYTIFIIISLWRCASKYKGRPLWAGYAHFTAVFMCLTLLAGFYNEFQKEEGNNQAYIEEAEMINKGLPKMLDGGTRVDHVSFHDNKLIYNHTLVNSDVAEMNVDDFNISMSAKLKTSLCEKQPIREILDDGIEMVYMYRDKADKPVTQIRVTLTDCFQK